MELIAALLEVLKAFGWSGLLIAICIGGVITVWRSSVTREKRMVRSLDDMRRDLVTILSTTVDNNTKAIQNMNAFNRERITVDTQILQALHDRKCLWETDRLPAIQQPPLHHGHSHRTPLPQDYPRQ